MYNCIHTHTHTREHVYIYIYIYIYIYGYAPAGPPPPWYPVMYSYTSISNGRRGAFSPPPVAPPSVLPCGTGYPSASAASPPPPPRFCASPPCRPGRKENPRRRTRPPPPPPVEQDGFPLCECMAILSPNPPAVEKDGFPFCSETHTYIHTYTHTHHVSVYVWRSLSVHALLLSLRSILPPPSPPMVSVMYSCTSIPVEQDIPLLLRHPLPPPPRFCALLPAASPPPTVRASSGSPLGLEASGPCIWGGLGGDTIGGGGLGGGGGENAQRTTMYIYIYMYVCAHIHTYTHVYVNKFGHN